MRRAIGQTWVLQLVIVFILLFAGYIILTINYSRTIRVKNEVVSIIEKYEGLNDYSLNLVNNYLATSGYGAKGVCTNKSQDGIYGGELNSNKLEKAEPKKKYHYCIKKYQGISITNYYQVTVFYKFNLPVIGEASGFTVKGTTNSFKSFDEDDYCNTITGTCRTSSSRPNTDANKSNTYTVRFNLNGGSGSVPNQTVKAGGTLKTPTPPTRAGYVFAGWSYNGTPFWFSTKVNQDMELIAIWREA